MDTTSQPKVDSKWTPRPSEAEMEVALTTVSASQSHIPVGVTGFEPATSSRVHGPSGWCRSHPVSSG